MIFPQYSLRKLLAVIVGFALFCLVVSWGVRGSSWALGVSIAGLSIALAMVLQAFLFWLVWLFAVATDRARARRAARGEHSQINTNPIATEPSSNRV